MRAWSDRTWTTRAAVVLLLALSLMVGAVSAAVPTLRTDAVARDDDDNTDEGGEIDEDDEDDNRGNGNDDDLDEDDNPGQGNGNGDNKDKDKGDDDEEELLTAVPTETPQQQAESAQPTTTPGSSPTTTASTPVTTGTLVIRLRVCPVDTDPADGTDALGEVCTDGQADAEFELSGRSGLYNGWRRDVTTGTGGDARVARLTEGTYHLTLSELDWCAAEASTVNDGLIAVEPGETTEVTAYLCGDPDDGTPAGG